MSSRVSLFCGPEGTVSHSDLKRELHSQHLIAKLTWTKMNKNTATCSKWQDILKEIIFGKKKWGNFKAELALALA